MVVKKNSFCHIIHAETNIPYGQGQVNNMKEYLYHS